MDKLADKDDKKHYFQLNWSALCFGSKWYLYRGMMKNVIKYLVYINLISILLLFGIRAMYNADFANYRSASEAYSDFVKYGGEKYLVDENGRNYAINPEYKMLRDARDETADDFNIVYIVGLAIVFGAEVLFRLSGNCLYRKHIKENIRTGEGGASIATMIGGIFILSFVERGLSILCLAITGVLEIIHL